jgi:glycosyltransferase involved in cell wall biosynthesis
MNLLILTQKLDINDDLLGFMHGWVAELSRLGGKTTVIALSVGEYNLPPKVKVLSLGKETGQSKLKYILRFYKYIYQERKNYDKVLVHMNKEYIILGGACWRFWGKKIALWYNHKKGNWFSRLAGRLADQIFYTSPFSFFAKWPKAKLMPVGINLDIFKPNPIVEKVHKSILFFGRISPVKKLDVFIEALNSLKKDGYNFKANIIGDAPERDRAYGESIKLMVKDYGLIDMVKFEKSVPNWQAPMIYCRHEIFINLTPAGSMDKTIFEAMACGNLVILCNRSFEKIFPEEFLSYLMFKENDRDDLTKKLVKSLIMEEELKHKYRTWAYKYILENHSVKKLVEMIFANFDN